MRKPKNTLPRANVSAEAIAAFLAAGHTIKTAAPAFAAPTQQSSLSLQRDIAEQRKRQRRNDRQLRERERLTAIYGTSDPFAYALLLQSGE